VKDGKAVLKKADGMVIAVPLERLSFKDRKFIADNSRPASPANPQAARKNQVASRAA